MSVNIIGFPIDVNYTSIDYNVVGITVKEILETTRINIQHSFPMIRRGDGSVSGTQVGASFEKLSCGLPMGMVVPVLAISETVLINNRDRMLITLHMIRFLL
jgi:hypothetical protein